jgi:hypothetical protein
VANGIEDLNTSVPTPNQSPIEMIIEMAAPSVTKVANDLGIPVNNEDTKRIAEGIAGGDSRVVLDVINEKLVAAPEELKSQLASKLISQAGMITTPAGQLNAINTTLQTGGDFIQDGLDFVGSKLDPDSRGANILGTTSDIIEGGQGIFGGMTNDLNKTVGNIVYDPIYGFVNLAGRNIIDPFANRINPLLNLLNRRQITPVIKQKPPPPQSFIDRKPPPPIVVTDIQKPYESGVGQDTGQTGGPGGMGFAPPSPQPPPTVPNTGMTYESVVNRANGGLVSVSRYLKGR